MVMVMARLTAPDTHTQVCVSVFILYNYQWTSQYRLMIYETQRESLLYGNNGTFLLMF